MAGSKKWMKYTADDGIQYGVVIDESNGEAAGFEDYADPAQGQPQTALPVLPKGAQMRYINVVDPTSGARRQIFVGKPDDDLWTGVATQILLPLVASNGLIAALTAFLVASSVGEKFTRPISKDTGLTDGDNT